MDGRKKGTCESLQISVLLKDINTCIKTLSHTQECLYRSHYEEVIREGRYQLLSILRQIKEQNCRKPSLVPKDDIERDIFMTEMECEHEETKIAHVRKEWTQQQNAMAKLQDHLYRKCRLLTLHSGYSSTQGSALCTVLAVLMENSELVEAYLSEPDKYLKNFIKIADGCLFSFVKTYAQDIPLEDSTDYRYIIALYTCILPISNSSRGRQFLTQREECRNMLSEIIYIIPHIKYSTAKTLKIILLKILHNLSNESNGSKFLRRCSEIFSTLNDCIMAEYDPEPYRYALELLELVTRKIPNKESVDKITTTLNTQRLKELSGQMYREVNNIPRKIFQNIRIAADKILAREQEQAQGDILRSKSGSVCKCKSNKSLELGEKRSASSSRKIHSKYKIHISQDMTPTRDINCKPSSAPSCSSYVAISEYSDGTPTRDTPQKITRPASGTSAKSMPSHKPVAALCSTPCKYLFPGSSCSCRPQRSKERPSNIPVRKTCIPTCSSRSRKREKKLTCSSSVHKAPCGRSIASVRPSSGGSCSGPSSCPSSKDRASSAGSRFTYIKDKIIELASSASRKLRSLIQTTPDVAPSCSRAQCTTISSLADNSKIPTKRDVSYSFNNQASNIKKTPCSCTIKNKKTPLSKTGRVCGPQCRGSSKYKKRKVVTQPSWKKRCSCITTKAKSTSPDYKHNTPSTLESNTLKSNAPQQVFTDLKYKKPTSCTDRPPSPVLKYTISFESKESSDQKTFHNKEAIEAATCVPICGSSLGSANTPSPANSSPSLNTECADEICTCGSQSERRLVPWTPENRMIARLSEIDRRVCHHAQNTIRIVSRLDNNVTGRTQRVVTRIRIPGLRFQRVVVDSHRRK